MEKYNERMKKIDGAMFKDDNWYIYFLNVKTNNSIKKLYEKKYGFYNDAINNILNEYIDKIMIENEYEKIYQYIDYVIKLLDKKGSLTDEKQLKSQGEFNCLVSLILLSNSIINFTANLNKNNSNIPNPKTDKCLEIDFFVHDDKNGIYLAIEIDGEQHKKDINQKNRDKIKNIFLEQENINFMRFDNNKKLFENIYNQFHKLLKEKGLEKFIINENKYKEICKYITNNTNFCSFSYELTIFYNIPNTKSPTRNYYNNLMEREYNLEKDLEIIKSNMKNSQNIS